MQPKATTLITGAGKRIGAAMARHLAARGHDLVLHYGSSAAEAEALASELRGAVQVMLRQADLRDTAALATFWDGLPPVTNLIHNASTYRRDSIADFTAADLREHLAVNLEAPLLLTQGFMNQLPADASGNVVLLGDDALGWSVSPHFFTYSVSKQALRATTELLAASCAPRVRANMIALAPTLPGETDSEAMFARLAERAPLKRTGTVEEVLAALDYVLSAPGLTGQVIGLGNGMGLTVARP